VSSRVLIPAPQRCCATSKRTGGPCQRWAKPGGVVCSAHGARAPQVADRADLRSTLAYLLAVDPRPPWQVVADHCATIDALAREAKLAARSGATLTGEQVQSLVDLSRAAVQAAKLASDLQVGEQSLALQREQIHRDAGAAVVSAIDVVLTELVDLAPSEHRDGWRDWSHRAAAAVFRSGPIPERPVFRRAIAASEAVEAVDAELVPVRTRVPTLGRQRPILAL
jgi:hypothetical protein